MFILNHKTAISLPRFSHKTDRKSKSKLNITICRACQCHSFRGYLVRNGGILIADWSGRDPEIVLQALCSVEGDKTTTMNGAYRMIWKETVMAYFKIYYHDGGGGGSYKPQLQTVREAIVLPPDNRSKFGIWNGCFVSPLFTCPNWVSACLATAAWKLGSNALQDKMLMGMLRPERETMFVGILVLRNKQLHIVVFI
jgi:hypothetical protein